MQRRCKSQVYQISVAATARVANRSMAVMGSLGSVRRTEMGLACFQGDWGWGSHPSLLLRGTEYSCWETRRNTGEEAEDESKRIRVATSTITVYSENAETDLRLGMVACRLGSGTSECCDLHVFPLVVLSPFTMPIPVQEAAWWRSSDLGLIGHRTCSTRWYFLSPTPAVQPPSPSGCQPSGWKSSVATTSID